MLTRAGEAKEKSEKAEYEDKVRLAVIAAIADGNGVLTESNLKAELKKNISELDESLVTGNEKYGWQVKIPNADKAFSISPDGESNEAFWEEVRDENGDISEIRRVDGTVTGLKVGDTINYNPTAGLDTTNNDQMQIFSSTSVNGYEDQTIDLRDYTGTWRLLGVEKGRLNLISSEIIGAPKAEGEDRLNDGVYTDLCFKLMGRTGYQNAETELNRVCSFYGKGTYALSARSINVEDINKITGYDPEHTGINVNKATEEQIAAGTKYGAGTIEEYGNKVTFEWDGTEYPKYSSSVASEKLKVSCNWSTFKGFSWWNGSKWNKSDYVEGKTGKICELISDYYYYYPETLTITNDTTGTVGIANDSVEKNMLFNDNDIYWLASRCIYVNSYYVLFGVRRVSSGENIFYLHLDDGRDCRFGIGLRPVVTLQPNTKMEKDGNDVWQIVGQ